MLAEHDDALLASYVDGQPCGRARLHRAVAAQTGAALLHPVYAGSAATGAGVPDLDARDRNPAPDRTGRRGG